MLYQKRSLSIPQSLKYILCFIIFLSVVVYVLFIHKQDFTVSGHSMEPTLHEGDVIQVNFMSVNKRKYERNDIAIFTLRNPEYQVGMTKVTETTPMVKRIVGVPGDKVKYRKDGIYINDVRISLYNELPDGEVVGGIYYSGEPDEIPSEPEIQLGSDEYFVLGDNLKESIDSRSFGIIMKDEIYCSISEDKLRDMLRDK